MWTLIHPRLHGLWPPSDTRLSWEGRAVGWTAPRGNGTPWTCGRRASRAGETPGGHWVDPGRGKALAPGRSWTKDASLLSRQPLEAQNPRGPVGPCHQSLGEGHCPPRLHGPSHRLSCPNTRQPPAPFVQHLLRAQSCPTLWDPHMDCSPPGSSVHGILQARILEWVVISFPRDLPNPGIKPCLLLGRRVLHRLSHLGAHCAERELISEQLGPTRLQKPRLTRYHREAFAGAVPKPDAGPDGSEDCWALPPRDGSHHLPRGRASPRLCAPQKTTAEAVKPSRS